MSLIAVTSAALLPAGSMVDTNPHILQSLRAGFEVRFGAGPTGPSVINDGTSRRTGVPYIDTGAGGSLSQFVGLAYMLRPDQMSLPATSVTYVMGFAARLAAGGSTLSQGPFGFQNRTNPTINGAILPCAVLVNTNGSMSVGSTNASAGGTLQNVRASSVIFMPTDNVARWYYIELKYVMGADSNTVRMELVVDGTTRIALTAAVSTYADFLPGALGFHSNAAGLNAGICDVYCLDNTGSTNTDYLGDCRVETLRPTANGANTGLTLVGAANHAAAVNETDIDGDTSYVRGVVGNKDTFVMSDLASTVGTVRGVAVSNIAEKESSTSRVVRGITRIGSTDYRSTGGNVDPAFLNYRPVQGIFDISPATSSLWTASEVNAMEAGVEIVS